MLQIEIQNWMKNLEKTQAQEAINQLKVQEMLAQQQIQIQAWMNPEIAHNRKEPEKLKDGILVDREAVGSKSSKHQYCWPSETDVQEFSPDIIPGVSGVYLWTGKTPNPFVTHIAIRLSNGCMAQTPTCIFD